MKRGLEERRLEERRLEEGRLGAGGEEAGVRMGSDGAEGEQAGGWSEDGTGGEEAGALEAGWLGSLFPVYCSGCFKLHGFFNLQQVVCVWCLQAATRRFLDSSCIRCHHSVWGLGPV